MNISFVRFPIFFILWKTLVQQGRNRTILALFIFTMSLSARASQHCPDASAAGEAHNTGPLQCSFSTETEPDLSLYAPLAALTVAGPAWDGVTLFRLAERIEAFCGSGLLYGTQGHHMRCWCNCSNHCLRGTIAAWVTRTPLCTETFHKSYVMMFCCGCWCFWCPQLQSVNAAQRKWQVIVSHILSVWPQLDLTLRFIETWWWQDQSKDS